MIKSFKAELVVGLSGAAFDFFYVNNFTFNIDSQEQSVITYSESMSCFIGGREFLKV